MRLKNHIRVIATTAAVAAVGAPAAEAMDIGEGGNASPVTSHHVVASPARSGSTDWALIALAGGGTAVLLGAGIGGSRSVARRRRSAAPARVA